MNKVVAVTGGSGFIGGKIIKELLKSGYKVISLQRTKKNIGNTEIRHFDLSDPDSITKKILSDIDVVIHAAALVHNPKANKNAHRTLNFDATKHLFKTCEEAEVNKFIFISTVGVYGLSSSKKKISIRTKTCPVSAYEIAKLDSEKILLRSNSSTAISIIRLPLVYGKMRQEIMVYLKKLQKQDYPYHFLIQEISAQ